MSREQDEALQQLKKLVHAVRSLLLVYSGQTLLDSQQPSQGSHSLTALQSASQTCQDLFAGLTSSLEALQQVPQAQQPDGGAVPYLAKYGFLHTFVHSSSTYHMQQRMLRGKQGCLHWRQRWHEPPGYCSN